MNIENQNQKNSAATVSLVCGIIGIFFATIGIFAITAGAKGIYNSKICGKGKVLSIIGIVLGILELIISFYR